MAPSTFVQLVFAKLKKKKLQVALIPSDSLDGGAALGTFHPQLGIAIAAHHPDWMAHLAHEFGHFEQFLEKHPDWDHSAFDLQEWLDGKVERDYADIENLVRGLQRLEHDAERRALGYIRKHRLTDPIAYARKANRYVLSFEIARRYRVWPNIGDEYLDHFPDRLIPLRRIGDHPVLPHFRPLKP
jgi:hypothetical protein